MLDAVLWGLTQGLTEFLPISSSGHLVLVPEVLGSDGPNLATSAVLHLGTLLSLLVYFRAEVTQMARFTGRGRRLLRWLVIGTIPAAAVGLALEALFERINGTPHLVALVLAGAGVALYATRFLRSGSRRIGDVTAGDALVIGCVQAVALVPGISRSGTTIAAGLARGLDRSEAARFGFLLGIPAIAGAGLLQFVELAEGAGGIPGQTWVGLGVAAVSGYAAIAMLLSLIRRAGLTPFGIYGVLAGATAYFLV